MAELTSSPLRFASLTDPPSGRRESVPSTPYSSQLHEPNASGTTATGVSTPRSGRPGARSDITSSHTLARFLQSQDPLAGGASAISRVSEDASLSVSQELSAGETQLTSATDTSDPLATENVIWGTTVNIADSMRMFRDFLTSFCLIYRRRWQASHDFRIPLAEVTTADLSVVPESDYDVHYTTVLKNIRETEMFNLSIDCANLRVYPPAAKLYQQLIKYPQEIIPLMDYTVTELFHQVAFSQEERDHNLHSDTDIKVRPFNLARTVNLRELDPSDIDGLVTVRGLLIRSSTIIPDLKSAFFRCLLCDHTMRVEIDRGRIDEPFRCPREACSALNTMQLVHNRSTYSNKQLCRLQETPDMIPDGQTPYTVSLCVYDDLVDTVKPGDRIEVTGIYRSMAVRPNPRQRVIKTVFRTYLDVVHFKRTDRKRLALDESAVEQNEFIPLYIEDDMLSITTPEDEIKIRELAARQDIYELLARSLAPSIYELDDVKKGVLLQLFGGTHKTFKKVAAPRYRGDINILLVGDPGVSKSQLLQYVHKIAPRGIYTSGKGSSAVGLTASVVRDPDTKALVLESGALVLSDGGICCIDEFDKMSDTTRAILHEVMEQQTVSIAKAGIITTLNARTSVLASANPIKSKFDLKLSLSENINLPPSLISRFDLLFVILDLPNEDYDRKLARHLVSLYLEDRPESAIVNMLAPEMLTRYISYARNKIKPDINEEAGAELVKRYVEMRDIGRRAAGTDVGRSGATGGNKTISATTRQLESMIRLAEAHARMRLSTVVEIDDVVEAARLIKEAIKASATDPRTGRIDIDLLTAGTSSSARRMFLDLKSAIRDMIFNRESSRIPYGVLYFDMSKQSSIPISRDDVDKVLLELASENIILLEKGTSMIRRLVEKDELDAV